MIFTAFYRINWKVFLIIVALILSVIGSYSYRALYAFYSYQKTVDPDIELTVDRFTFLLRDELNKLQIALLAPPPLSDYESPLKSFHITINPKDIKKLDSDLPVSGMAGFVNAYLRVSDAEKIKKIKLRYRGDTFLHWLYPQKSLRIKVPKKNLYHMERTFNLLNPPHSYSIIDCVAYDISRKVGLLAPEFYPVRLFLNGEYHGCYLYLSQVKESLLRKAKRMPGSIYYGDGAPLNSSGVSDLWFNQAHWQKKASRNAEQKADRRDIAKFIDAINNYSDQEFYKFFKRMINAEKYNLFFALDTLFGAFHHDYSHNHKLYFDPYLGKFEPVQWDLRYWSPNPAKDTAFYPLLERVKLNPLLEAARDQVGYEVMERFGPEKILPLLDYYRKISYRDLASDINRDSGIRDKLFPAGSAVSFSMSDFDRDIDEKKKVFTMRREILGRIYKDARVEYRLTRQSAGTCCLLFKVDGNSPVVFDLKPFWGRAVQVFRDLDFDGILSSADALVKEEKITLYPGRKFIPGNALNAGPAGFGNRRLINSPLFYSFIIKGVVADLIPPMNNMITGDPVQPVKADLERSSLSDSIHPWSLPCPQPGVKLLSGAIELDKDLVFPESVSVNIAPGTTFNLGPGVSIFFYGKVTALASPDNPIVFQAAKRDQPWGVLAVQGQAAAGSSFQGVVFENGSIASRNLIDYTAPFNIHDVDRFEVKNCIIGANFKGDDAMHVAYAKGVIDACRFTGALSDALDVDIAEVTVSNCLFRNCGNDGIDLMTAQAVLSGNSFINTGDKGLSVGEWSTVELKESFFKNNLIAIEVKDKSRLHLDTIAIIDAREKAINLYNKNKHYDEGGRISGARVFVSGNRQVSVDGKSSANLKFLEEFPAGLENGDVLSVD